MNMMTRGHARSIEIVLAAILSCAGMAHAKPIQHDSEHYVLLHDADNNSVVQGAVDQAWRAVKELG